MALYRDIKSRLIADMLADGGTRVPGLARHDRALAAQAQGLELPPALLAQLRALAAAV
ncbi:Uncharacterised protein [Delftia tsuruhatensis]|uniref:hypothetical protein n=1 Tax=Delftia tsuruhatensis TaxID=180282 RepID=UPI001E7F0D61|nr:hypothetical protein [Delftia tsuruhatensis]CAB5675989.1 Uncharacterised protein [Delftia tsuruhatensis]CAC9692738.1 Uncharacterised protein [Delftia tsuruhatensis]